MSPTRTTSAVRRSVLPGGLRALGSLVGLSRRAQPWQLGCYNRIVQSTAAFQPDLRLPAIVAERKEQSEREHMRRVWARILQGAKPAREAAREAREQAANAVAEIQTLAHLFVISHTEVEFDNDFIDELLGAKPFQEAYLAFARAARSMTVPARPARNNSETLFPPSVFEDAQTRERLMFIDRLIVQVDAASEVLARHAGELPRFAAETTEAEQDRSLLWFVYDPGVPAEIAEAMLALRRSETAFMLAHAAHAAPGYWKPTALRAIALLWADEYEKYARYIAGFPFVNVTLIPDDKKVRVADLVTKQKKVLEHVHAEGDKAIAELGR